jgi:protein-S-isoprenylcysteine O-methyltransferase
VAGSPYGLIDRRSGARARPQLWDADDRFAQLTPFAAATGSCARSAVAAATAIGSALATGPGWLVVVIGAGAYFVVSLRVEETDMAAAFPEQYPEYAGHTKRLIPFVY